MKLSDAIKLIKERYPIFTIWNGDMKLCAKQDVRILVEKYGSLESFFERLFADFTSLRAVKFEFFALNGTSSKLALIEDNVVLPHQEQAEVAAIEPASENKPSELSTAVMNTVSKNLAGVGDSNAAMANGFATLQLHFIQEEYEKKKRDYTDLEQKYRKVVDENIRMERELAIADGKKEMAVMAVQNEKSSSLGGIVQEISSNPEMINSIAGLVAAFKGGNAPAAQTGGIDTSTPNGMVVKETANMLLPMGEEFNAKFHTVAQTLVNQPALLDAILQQINNTNAV